LGEDLRDAGAHGACADDAGVLDRHAALRCHSAQLTLVSRSRQNGSRSSRLRIFPAADFGIGSVRSSIRFGSL
jgi:hypothetical protein